MAARAVYEGVEPYVFWSIVYGKLLKTEKGHEEQEVVSLLRASISDHDVNLIRFFGQKSALNLSIWILNTFRIQDEEVTRIHLPLILHLLIAVRGESPFDPSTETNDSVCRTTSGSAKWNRIYCSQPYRRSCKLCPGRA